MGKLNRPPTVAQIDKQMRKRPDATVNQEGGLAFSMSPKLELYQRVGTWLVEEPKFYGNDSETDDIMALVAKIAEDDPEFILQLAAYARNELYLRSAPVFLLAHCAKYEGTRKLIPQFAPHIIKRADEICEVLGAYSALNPGKSVPRKLRKGLDNALRQFNEYQLAKYDRKGEWTLRDALRVIRPKPATEEERVLWGKVVSGNLMTPETWETEISGGGASKEAWEKIMPKMGIMALIRNLRNFLKHGCDVTYAIDQLTNPEVIARSKQFPYRFYSAYHAINQHRVAGDQFIKNKLNDALITGIKLSVDNLPTLPGNTLIACDNSGSMRMSISGRSEITCDEVANLMGALAYGYCENASVCAYGSEVVPVRNMSVHDSPFTNMEKIAQTNTMGVATYAYKIVKLIENAKYDVDRIIVFTDEECYSNSHLVYGFYGGCAPENNGFVSHMVRLRGRRKKPIWLYVFNLKSSGTTMMPEDDPHTYLISGYSDKIFQFMNQFETDPNIVLESISNYIKTE